jgi:hypothetical protein
VKSFHPKAKKHLQRCNPPVQPVAFGHSAAASSLPRHSLPSTSELIEKAAHPHIAENGKREILAFKIKRGMFASCCLPITASYSNYEKHT